jgi:hypothetical protein
MAQFTDFLSKLNTSKQQAIVWHNQTDSYAEHKALNKYYDAVVDNLDGLVESVSGVYGRPLDYTVEPLVNYQSVEQVQSYFRSLFEYVQSERKNIYQDSFVQNQIDELEQLLGKTMYLLTLA